MRDLETLNAITGWIVAVWLLLAFLTAFTPGGSYAPYACMGGAMATLGIWVLARRNDPNA